MLQADHLYHDSLNNKVLLGKNKHDLINLLSHKYPGNITCWIQRATRPSDWWQRCIQLVIFPSICAIICMYTQQYLIVYGTCFISELVYISCADFENTIKCNDAFTCLFKLVSLSRSLAPTLQVGEVLVQCKHNIHSEKCQMFGCP